MAIDYDLKLSMQESSIDEVEKELKLAIKEIKKRNEEINTLEKYSEEDLEYCDFLKDLLKKKYEIQRQEENRKYYEGFRSAHLKNNDLNSNCSRTEEHPKTWTETQELARDIMEELEAVNQKVKILINALNEIEDGDMPL